MGCSGVKLRAVGPLKSADIAGEFDRGNLHAKADPEVRNSLFPGVARSGDLPFGSAVAEAPGNKDTSNAIQVFCRAVGLNFLGVDDLQIDSAVVGASRMAERLVDALVSILELLLIFRHN